MILFESVNKAVLVALAADIKHIALNVLMSSKHASVVIGANGQNLSGRCIGNYLRTFWCGYKCFSMHAEMAAIGSMIGLQYQSCIKRNYALATGA